MFRILFLLPVAVLLLSGFSSCAQPLNKREIFTRQDTLRGTNGPGRDWWDVTRYVIEVTPDYTRKSIRGHVAIEFRVPQEVSNRFMQIDLQQPMQLDSVFEGNKKLSGIRREGNAYFIDLRKNKYMPYLGENKAGIVYRLRFYFSGKPREAVNPPWDGGWIWTKDKQGNPWMTVACQGLGTSVWYPCKDYQGDEPDYGAGLSITVPDSLSAIGNGRLTEKESAGNGLTTWRWVVKNPINNYNIIPYIGRYSHRADTLHGEGGLLSLDYWVLKSDSVYAHRQFDRDVKRMLRAFEYWFGPYPFYEDGYKLVESSHLGMEHQSNIAYGNHFTDGYLGMDLSGSGWGKKWDYIIVHESGHEWFANNITTNDIADMWVHEGFTMYSEVLFTETEYGKQAADEYLQGIRRNINNDRPLIGPYGVNKEGSGDMYNKGASLLHTIRQVIHNDSLFRQLLRGLNRDFRHQTVNSTDVEQYFSRLSGIGLQPVFDQYLRTIKIPVLEYRQKGRTLQYRWTNCVDGFDMPVDITGPVFFRLSPRTSWQETELPDGLTIENYNRNYYIQLKKTD